MRRKQLITIQITTLLFLWTKSARWNVVQWTLISQMKPGFTAVDTFECRYQDEYGMYCGFFYTCFDVYCLLGMGIVKVLTVLLLLSILLIDPVL